MTDTGTGEPGESLQYSVRQVGTKDEELPCGCIPYEHATYGDCAEDPIEGKTPGGSHPGNAAGTRCNSSMGAPCGNCPACREGSPAEKQTLSAAENVAALEAQERPWTPQEEAIYAIGFEAGVKTSALAEEAEALVRARGELPIRMWADLAYTLLERAAGLPQSESHR